MTSLIHLLRRYQPKTFRISYGTDYNLFAVQHVLNDPQHPLHIQRKREQERRKKEGLWWHATTGTELSKSSVVRSWCRRRLNNAFTDVLKKRGFDQYGRLVDAEALQVANKRLGEMVRGHQDFNLKGSFRFHALVPCIPAKYAELQEEFGIIMDAMLEGAQKQFSPVRYNYTDSGAYAIGPQLNSVSRSAKPVSKRTLQPQNLPRASPRTQKARGTHVEQLKRSPQTYVKPQHREKPASQRNAVDRRSQRPTRSTSSARVSDVLGG